MKTKFIFMEFKTWLDGRIKLYNGDCLEFMENMQEQVDLILIIKNIA